MVRGDGKPAMQSNRERNRQIAQGLEAFSAKERAGFEEGYQ